MAHIPPAILLEQKPIAGLPLRGQGKVRDSFDLPDHPSKMLVVASDRCSIFDFVLKTLIPWKGQVLTGLNHFWVTQVLAELFETDFVAGGSGIDEYLQQDLRGNPELQARATVVTLLSSPQVEDIVRIILTGSGWKSYQKDGTVCGHKLPKGLINGSLLPFPIYTPTTKAVEGHDEHLDVNGVIERYGFMRERLALQVILTMADYAKKRQILLGDGKLEMVGNILIDEKGTPDSCRFMDLAAYNKAIAKGKLAPSLDKQYVRNWGIEQGIDKLDPADPEALKSVDSLDVPAEIVHTTTLIYRYIFWRLTGMKIETYERTKMGIVVSDPKPRVEIVVGSESDLGQAEPGIAFLKTKTDVRVSVVSCHRNPGTLVEFTRTALSLADVVIAGAGKAAALPGIVKSLLCDNKQPTIPVIGVAFKGETKRDNEAAVLSIENLPGQPVELDKFGEAYFGANGFLNACAAALDDEFLPKSVESKPAKIGI